MSNEFKVKNGLIVIGDLTTSGTITINGALAATQSWVTSQAYLTSSSLTSYATQSYVTSAIASLVDSAPGALDTLRELATALGNDASFSTTVTNSIAAKLPLAGGTLTGALTGTSATFSGDLRIAGVGTKLYFDTLSVPNSIYQYVENNYDLHFINTRGDGARFVLGNNIISFGTVSAVRFSISQVTGAATFSSSVTAERIQINSTTYEPLAINSSYGQVGLKFGLNGSYFAAIGSANNVTGAYAGSETDLGIGTSGSATANITFATGTGLGRRMTITAAGNVGINTTSPTEKLHVDGRIMAAGSGYTLNPTAPIFGQYSSTRGYVQVPSNGQFEIWTGGTAEIATFYNNQNVAFFGNVGIGTTSPSSPLHVVGTITAATTVDSGRINLGTQDTNQIGLYRDNTYDLVLVQDASSGNPLYLAGAGDVRVSIDSNNNQNNSKFIVGNNDKKSSNELFYVDESGSGYFSSNVGIGTSSPNEKLHVAGNVHAYAAGGIDSGLFASTSAGSTTIAIRSNGITHFNGGSVGIGTSTPANKLVVTSDASPTSENSYAIAAASASDPAYKTIIGYDYTNDIGLIAAVRTGIGWRNLSIPQGSLGIGTYSPSVKLHVVGNAWINRPTNKVDNNGATEFGSRVEFNNAFAAGSTGYTVFNYPSASVFRIYGDYDGNIGGLQPDLQLGLGYLTVKNSGGTIGNIGIGTTAPTHRLTVAGGNVLMFPSDNTRQLSFFNDSYGITASSGLELITGDYIRFRQGSTELARLTTTGLGIGTTSPTGKLDIVPSAQNAINISRAGGYASLYSSNDFVFETDSIFYFGVYTPRLFSVNGSFYTTVAGSVGIGTSSPTQKLHVVGNQYITGTITVGASGNNSNVNFVRSDGSSVGGIGWKNDGIFYVGGHLDYGPNAGNNVRVYGFGANLFLGNNTSGDVLTITNGGNVGIGTTSPSYKLDISGALRATGTVYSDNGSLAGALNLGQVVSIGSSFGSYANLIFTMHNGGGFSDIMKLQGNGNVGIGTTSPAAKLHVVGNTYIQSGALFVDTIGGYTTNLISLAASTNVLVPSGDITIGSGASTGSSQPFGDFSQLKFDNLHSDTNRGPNKIVMHDNGGSWIGGFGIHSDTVSYYTGGFHRWYKTDSQTSSNQVMQLDASGNLTIAGTLSASGYNKSNWDTAYSWGNHASAGYLTSETDTLASVTSRGATTSSTLTSTAQLGLYVNSGSASYIGINSTSNWAYVSLLNNGSTTWDIGAYNGGELQFRPYGSGTNVMILGLDGSVTINSLNDGKLNLRVPSGDSSDWNYINFTGSNGVRDTYFGTDSGGTPTWWRDDNGVNITLGSSVLINGNTAWHAGNDGSGSGLDADTVDGVQASSLLRSDIYNSNYGGLQVFRNIGTIDGSWEDSSHTFSLENGDAGNIVLNFHRAGYTSNNLWYNGSKFRFDAALESTGVITATGGNSTNWNTAFGWGNHASYSYATTSYVTTQINNLIAGAPGALDTLDELAAALGDDSNFATTVTNSIATKLPLAGGTMTGNLQVNAKVGTLDNQGIYLRGIADATHKIYYRTSDGGNVWEYNSPIKFEYYNNGIPLTRLTLDIAGNLTIGGFLTESSSIKLKENVETSEGNLEKVVNLRPVTYNKIGSKVTELGLIAEEVAEVYPEFVQYDENGEPVGVNYSRLTAALIGAIKELTQRIETLENNG